MATFDKSSKLYHVGTLTYTKAALVLLFFWLFWGDFCYTVMESVTGPIMQLKFKALDASNKEIGLILSTIPTAVYSILNPIISFRSDRFRSRWGRRIPFILGSLPFLVLFLIGLAYGDRIGAWLYGHIGWFNRSIPWLHPFNWLHEFSLWLNQYASWLHPPFLHRHADGRFLSSSQTIILTLGALLVVFTFFNTFVTSTFWYLFNDVMPEHLLARFMSWFRAIGSMSAAMYNFFIFPYSGTHSTQIFVGAALLYLVGFVLMCYNVREGKYPPPAPYVGGKTGLVPAVWTYAKGTHAFPHYWYLWICTFIGGIAGGVATFGLFFNLAIGLNLTQIGRINGTVGLMVSVLTIGSGWLADRFHPIRVVLAGNVIGLFIVTPLGLIWMFWLPSPHVVFWISMAISLSLSAPSQALGGMWDPPMLMRLFPRANYGQFCSTNAVWRSVGGMVGGVLTGAYLDFITPWVGKERAYFYLPLWQLFFGIPSFYLLYRLYLSWKKHGGDDAYVAPALEMLTPDPASASPALVPTSQQPAR